MFCQNLADCQFLNREALVAKVLFSDTSFCFYFQHFPVGQIYLKPPTTEFIVPN